MNVEEFLNEPDLDQDRALHLAAETGKAESVELCLKHCAHVNAQRATLMTPLHIAAMKGDLEIVKVLCRNGADLHMKDNEKQTPLHRWSRLKSPADVLFVFDVVLDQPQRRTSSSGVPKNVFPSMHVVNITELDESPCSSVVKGSSDQCS